MGLADVNLDLADVKIDPSEVLPRRVRNLLGPPTLADSTSASEEASLDSSLVEFKRDLLNESLVTAVQRLVLLAPTGKLPPSA